MTCEVIIYDALIMTHYEIMNYDVLWNNGLIMEEDAFNGKLIQQRDLR